MFTTQICRSRGEWLAQPDLIESNNLRILNLTPQMLILNGIRFQKCCCIPRNSPFARHDLIIQYRSFVLFYTTKMGQAIKTGLHNFVKIIIERFVEIVQSSLRSSFSAGTFTREEARRRKHVQFIHAVV